MISLLFRHTVEPFGVVLGSAQRRESSKASVNSWVPPGKVHSRGGIEFPTGSDEGSGVMKGVIGTAGHSTDLIMDLCQVGQLWCWRQRERIEKDEHQVIFYIYMQSSLISGCFIKYRHFHFLEVVVFVVRF